jgi:hypothetical protein
MNIKPIWTKTLNWIRRLFRLPKKETPEEKTYREYFNKMLLEHRNTALHLYDPDYKVQIPKNPETTKRIFRPPLSSIKHGRAP